MIPRYLSYLIFLLLAGCGHRSTISGDSQTDQIEVVLDIVSDTAMDPVADGAEDPDVENLDVDAPADSTTEGDPDPDAPTDVAAEDTVEEEPQCLADSDCDDLDPCTSDACVSGSCSNTAVDADDDGHAAAEVEGTMCSGADCDDADADVHPGALEVCNGRDDDCDELVDEVDGAFACGDGCCNADEDECACPEDCGPEPCGNGVCCESSETVCTCIDDCGPVPAPLPLWPPNGHLTGSVWAPASFMTRRPLLRWLPVIVGCDVTYDVQVEDDCTVGEYQAGTCAFASPVQEAGVSATSWRPGTDLAVDTLQPVGRRYYWRVRACVGAGSCSEWSAVRYMDVGRVHMDLDGDGYSDVVVGAYHQDAGAMDEGNVFIYPGSASGVSDDPSLVLDNPGNEAGAEFGRAVAGAGDLDADGYADLVVGARYQSGGALAEGNAFVYLGSASGVPALPSITLDNPENQTGGMFGGSVAGAGDLDADGYADLVVGAPWQDTGADHAGNAYVYLGSVTGVASVPDITLDNPAYEPGGLMGSGVSGAGDLDADGYADLVVGANGQDAGAMDEGNAFVYMGGPWGVATTPDVTLDNPDDQAEAQFGLEVASAGDLDGDGYAEFVVGAHLQDAGADDEGNAFVYSGGPGGVSAVPTVRLDNPTNQEDGRFARQVSPAGDVDGDGYDDLAVGAYWQDPAGKAYIYTGSVAGIAPVPSITKSLPSSLIGLTDGFGRGVAWAGDVDGDGYDDIIMSSPGGIGYAFVYQGGPTGLTLMRTLIDPPAEIDSGFGDGVALIWWTDLVPRIRFRV